MDIFNNSYEFNDNCVEFESKAGRHCRSLVWKYFKYDSMTNITRCLVEECTSKGIKGKLAGNLKRHLRTHQKQFKDFNKAVNRLELNINTNKKVFKRSSNESMSQNSNESNDKRSFDLSEINEYLMSNPKEDTTTDVVYPYRSSSIGRKYESSVWKFFNYDSNENIAYCLVNNCKSKGIRGKLAGNLRKHLLTHKREFDGSMAKNQSLNQFIDKSIVWVLTDSNNSVTNGSNLRQQSNSEQNISSYFPYKQNINEENSVEFVLNYEKHIKNELNVDSIDLL